MNKLLLLAIITISIFGCKQIYEPDIDSDNSNIIVINGVITNDTVMSRVIITRAQTFSNNNTEQFVSGAEVKVYDNDGVIYNLSETSNGEYRNPSLKAEAGKTYFLEVITTDGDVYRSETQSLPPKVNVDSTYGEIFNEKFVVVKKSGESIVEKKILQPYLDLTNSVSEIPECRFTFKYTIVTGVPQLMGVEYHWRTQNNLFPAISNYPKYPISVNNQMKRNPLNYLYTDMTEYGLPGSLVAYVLFIDKYDLNPGTFLYYKKIKEQSEYAGKVFDAIPSQIEGNITCVNNPDKLTLGNFEVSNAEQFIYFCRIYSSSDISFRKKDALLNFTEFGKSDSLPKFLR